MMQAKRHPRAFPKPSLTSCETMTGFACQTEVGVVLPYPLPPRQNAEGKSPRSSAYRSTRDAPGDI
jgi:hypothetical protein